ncbi:MAG TPA: tetratricopeptide repeat protein, partial [Phycisphaerales bacterium]|nr:tetratricopeptide repeat protein [Phycisphaerales bacterium]
MSIQQGNRSDPLDVVIGAGPAHERDPRAAAEQVAAAERAEAAGDRSAQIEALRRAVAADPTDPRLFFRLAYALDLAG